MIIADDSSCEFGPGTTTVFIALLCYRYGLTILLKELSVLSEPRLSIVLIPHS